MQQSDRFLNQTFDRFLWPTVLSVLGGTVNVMVDSVMIGNVLGQAGLAAVNLPVYLLLCTLGSLIATGAGIRSSVAIGKAGEEAGRRYYTLAFWLLLGMGTAVSILGLCLLAPLLDLLGAVGAVRGLALDYLRITLAGGVFKVLLYLPFQYLRLDGRPGLVTGLLLLMTSLNAGLDLVFLMGLHRGMAGAAAASVLATAAAVLLGMGFLHQKVSTFHLKRERYTPEDVLDIVHTGSPAALNNLLCALRLIVLNRVLLAMGGSALVAVFTMVCSMGEFSLALISGVPQTASPLMGVYSGERDTGSIRRLMRRQFLSGGALIVAFALGSALLAKAICRLFGLTGAIVDTVAVPALWMFALSLPFAMVCGVLISFYNTAGHIALANTMTAGRVFLFAAGSAVLLSHLGSPVWIWLFYPLAELLTLVLWPLLARLARRGNKALSAFYLLDETLEREGRSLNFSVENSLDAVVEASEKISGFCEENELPPKKSMAVSLSIEEMLTIILQNCFAPGETKSADVRIFCLPGIVGLRIRNGGKAFNPLIWYEAHRDEDETGDTLGLKLITSLAQVTTYQRTFGVNTLIILLENGAKI